MAAKRRFGPSQSPAGAQRSGAAPKALDGGGPMWPPGEGISVRKSPKQTLAENQNIGYNSLMTVRDASALLRSATALALAMSRRQRRMARVVGRGRRPRRGRANDPALQRPGGRGRPEMAPQPSGIARNAPGQRPWRILTKQD